MHPINGILLIDKDPDMTSHDVVARVRRVLGIRAIGHAGTLDPLATGLLVLLIGEATKISDYLLNGDKGYEVGVRFGMTTDSHDITGKVLSRSLEVPSFAAIEAATIRLTGTLSLKVPVHSAVKVDGERLYKSAHRGEVPDGVPMREMRFFDVTVAPESLERVSVKFTCSKGSFVRSWVHELGQVLACGAVVETLRRSYSQPFGVTDALRIEAVEEQWQSREKRDGRIFGPAWIALKDTLGHFSRVDVSGNDETLLRNGQISSGLKLQLLSAIGNQTSLPPVRVVSRESDDLIALLIAKPGEFYRIKRVFLNA